ncbi:MAG: hypothetical protein GX230_02255 [Lentisphaerae bacterium]|nr:hypothetical protein [Lentisphaerota bacterium]
MINSYLYDIDYTPPAKPTAPGSAIIKPSVGGPLQGALDDLLADDDKPRATRDDEVLTPAKFITIRETPVAGFVVEMGDAAQYGSFAKFREHFAAAKLDLAWESEKRQVEVSYCSGDDTLEMSYDPQRYPVPRRAINGEWPYLAKGVMRASPWAIQGSAGELELQGAILRNKPGLHAYLQAVPEADTFIGYQPMPQLSPWSLTLPDGSEIVADGDVGLLRVVARPVANRVWVEQIYTATQQAAEAPPCATGLLLKGFKAVPQVYLNRVEVKAEAAGDATWRIVF